MRIGQDGRLLAIGAGGTAGAMALTLLVWIDNRAGFRDAEAFATLLAALFSMIATVWLIVTVLLQRAELELQRNELALQRQESRRIADETRHQAQLMTAQLTIALKQSFVADMTAYFTTRLGRIKRLADTLREGAREVAAARIGCDAEELGARTFGHSDILFKRKGSAETATVDYGELGHVLPADLALKTINRWYGRAADSVLEEWFRIELPYSVGNLEKAQVKLTTVDTRLIVGVAARMQFDQ